MDDNENDLRKLEWGEHEPVYVLKPVEKNEKRANEIEIKSLIKVVITGKVLIVATCAIFAIVSLVYSLSLPNIYRSQVIVFPASGKSGDPFSSLNAKFGGLASIAGLNLSDKHQEKNIINLEIFKSKQFILSFIKKNQLEVPLIAAHGWDKDANKIILDEDIYSVEQDSWVFDEDGRSPSDSELYARFNEVLTIVKNKKTSMITVRIEFYSPYIVERWVSLLVEQINFYLKEKDVSEASRNMKFLRKQIEETPLTEMTKIFNQLVEEQIKIIMLAEGRKDYAFKVIDPAFIPEFEDKIGPNRAIICVAGTALGFFVGCVAALFRSRDLLNEGNRGVA